MEVHIADVNFFVGVILNCPYMSGLNLSSNAELKTVMRLWRKVRRLLHLKERLHSVEPIGGAWHSPAPLLSPAVDPVRTQPHPSPLMQIL